MQFQLFKLKTVEVSDFVILVVLVVSFVVTDIIVITLKASEELPKKYLAI